MTMRSVEVLQLDLQREFCQARQKAAQPHRCPILAVPNASPNAGLPGIRQALTAARHLLEMYRRQLTDEKIRLTLRRLDRRLRDIDSRLDRLATAEFAVPLPQGRRSAAARTDLARVTEAARVSERRVLQNGCAPPGAVP